MSMTQRQSSKVTCHNLFCTEQGDPDDFIDREYCDDDCRWEAKGREFLKGFRYTHTHCFTCGTELKEIERPEDSVVRRTTKAKKSGWILNAFIGFEYTTPNADYGEKDFGSSTGTGVVCGVCGNTSHSAHIEELSTEGMLEHVQLFLDGLDEYTEESFDHSEVLYGILDGDSLELSIGRALKNE